VAVQAKEKRTFNWTPLLMVIAVLALAGGGFYALEQRNASQQAGPSALSPEARTYVRSLGLSGVAMKAAESYMKTTLVEITGSIQNKGDRRLKLVEINCLFYDPYGTLVLRERVPIVKRNSGQPLQPGETRSFRLPFDSIPSTWNQVLPQLVIARIDFEE